MVVDALPCARLLDPAEGRLGIEHVRGECFLWDPKAMFKETTVKCAVGIDEALMKVIQHVWEGLVEWLI